MKDFMTALHKVMFLMSQKKVPCHIGGSLLLARSGIKTEVHDIDLLFRYQDYETVKSLLSDYVIEHASHEGYYLTIELLKIHVEGVDFDLIFDFSFQSDGMIYTYPFDKPKSSFRLKIDGHMYSFSRLEEWYLIYSLLPNRSRKVKLIADYFAQHRNADSKYLKAMLKRNLPESNVEEINRLIKDCAM